MFRLSWLYAWDPVDYFIQKRISGPLLDRIDIHLDVPRIPHEQLSDRRPGEPSAAIQERVERAREIQATRFAGTALLTNADMGPKELRQHAALDDTAETLLGSAVRQMGLSARAYHRVLKLARTIADLAPRSPSPPPMSPRPSNTGPAWPRVRTYGSKRGS